MPFPLLDLPPEIRTKIYLNLITCTEPITLNSATAHSSVFPFALLLTCLQLYQEIRPLYFSSNTFRFVIHRHNNDWDYFLDREWEDNRRQIRELSIDVVRWGKSTFWRDTVKPILQDMVLNGCLRRVEIILAANSLLDSGINGYGKRSQPLQVRKSYITATHRGWLRKMPPFTMVEGLLQDPYLEHVKLYAKWDESLKQPGGGFSENTKPDSYDLQDVSWLLNK
ncbi:hypothetical protein PVAG01_06302 [Phlyctema vagabunda]|uniref:F-box domain-containing protein n=1 Tax=Phlyctema vagabunda TaxID=108571 RepID=A0ABR4PFN6_9HELO